jgi:NitT/TauT family transport system substrate-binding protein
MFSSLGRPLLLASASLATMSLLVASPAGTSAARAQELKTWRQAMIAPKADAGFFLMAAKRGFAEKEGLKIEVVDVKDDQVGMRALLSGEVDSFDTTTGGIASASRGADGKFVGCSWLAIPYVILAKPSITKVEELKGKTIAASSPGTPPDTVARGALGVFKVAEADVKFAAVGGDRDRYNALLAGIVDAAVVANEYTPLPSSKGFNMILQARDALPKSVRFCTFMTGKTLSTRREEAIRFLTAEIKAFRYAVSHRDETIKLAHEATDTKPDDPRAAYVFDEAVKPGVVAPDFPLPMENLAWIRDQLVGLGQIPKGLEIEKMVDADLREQALKRAGK